MRTIIIGDIHGSYHEWVQLMKAVHLDRATDRLILLGDLMDRGKDSYQVYCEAVSLQKEMKDRFILIKGSHEKFLLEEHLSLPQQLLWLVIGKLSTIRSFKHNGRRMEESIPWFQEYCVPYYETELFQCVHAGVSKEQLSENNEYTLMMDHKCTRKNSYTGKLTITGHVRFKEPTWFDGSGGKGKPLPYHQQMHLPPTGFICIDTGCAEGNKLTAMVITGQEYYLTCSVAKK